MGHGFSEKADGTSSTGAGRRKGNYHRHLKRYKNRIERRRAKEDPECVPRYGRYQGWEM
jgi:hypothetical protein